MSDIAAYSNKGYHGDGDHEGYVNGNNKFLKLEIYFCF